MSPQHKEKFTWIFRSALSALMLTVLGYVVSIYNRFEALERSDVRKTEQLQYVNTKQLEQGIQLQIQTGRIDKIYESGIMAKAK